MPETAVQDHHQTLADAVARSAAAVLSISCSGKIRNFKTRFLGESEMGIWIEVPDLAGGMAKNVYSVNQEIGVSFLTNHRRLSFVTTIVQIDPEFRINQTVTTTAIQVAPAAEIKVVQRRSAYRVTVPSNSDLIVKVWRIANHVHISDRPLASQEIKVQLRNLSTGGMLIQLADSQPRSRKLAAEQRLRIELRYQELELILDGQVRCDERPGESNLAGIIFKIDGDDLDGRQDLAALTRIVGDLSQDEVKRVRRVA
jgi:hypothetical protein